MGQLVLFVVRSSFGLRILLENQPKDVLQQRRKTFANIVNERKTKLIKKRVWNTKNLKLCKKTWFDETCDKGRNNKPKYSDIKSTARGKKNFGIVVDFADKKLFLIIQMFIN